MSTLINILVSCKKSKRKIKNFNSSVNAQNLEDIISTSQEYINYDKHKKDEKTPVSITTKCRLHKSNVYSR